MSRIYPVYLDLIYVPHHGNSKYVSADFFKRVRARNYVFSGTDPSKEVLNALIEGKQTWEDQDLGEYHKAYKHLFSNIMEYIYYIRGHHNTNL